MFAMCTISVVIIAGKAPASSTAVPWIPWSSVLSSEV